MEHTAQPAQRLLVDESQRVVFRFARVNDDGQAAGARQAQLGAKNRLLDLTRRKIVVIIETNLANGARARRRVESAGGDAGSRLRIVGKLVGLVRMDTDRKPHDRPRRGQLIGPLELLVIFRRKNDQAPGDACLPGPRNDGFEISENSPACQVAVRIDHRQRTRCQASRARR